MALVRPFTVPRQIFSDEFANPFSCRFPDLAGWASRACAMSVPIPPTILFVDDDSLNRLALTGCLQEAGFRTREAATGAEALRIAAEGPVPPDLVILDVNLPDVDGFEVCRRLRADPATTAIPILHLSGVFMGALDKAHALEGGADGYLTKPADPQEVIATVRALLRAHQAEETARAAARAWEATFDAIPDALLLLDAQGTIARCNRAVGELLGLRVADVLGCPVRSVFARAFGTEGGAVLDSVGCLLSQEPTEVRVGRRLAAHLDRSRARRWPRAAAGRGDCPTRPGGTPAPCGEAGGGRPPGGRSGP